MGSIFYQIVRLIFGFLHPGYKSFKAVKTKNVKEYVHWMTYWIVLACVTVVEEFADIIFSCWFPLYYEIKILLIFCLISPVTRGSVVFYRKLIHPILLSKEEEIDEIIHLWKEQSYQLGIKYTKVAAEKITKTVLQTAISGGNGLMRSLHHSYSMNDLRRSSLTEPDQTSVVPKRTMSVNRRERPHQSQSPSTRSDSVRRRPVRPSSTTTATSSSSNKNEAAKKTCSLYGTLPRNVKRRNLDSSSTSLKDQDRKRGSRLSLLY